MAALMSHEDRRHRRQFRLSNRIPTCLAFLRAAIRYSRLPLGREYRCDRTVLGVRASTRVDGGRGN
jgi:hypothetical protein